MRDVLGLRREFGRVLITVGLGFFLGCEAQASDVDPGATAESAGRECTDPRPEVCAQDYRPVCATRDAGIRCVTAPCPATERRTYSNACSACSDPKVARWAPGACPEPSDS